MHRKILRFDGGGGVDYGDSWADLTADEPVNFDPQTVFPEDGGALHTLDYLPVGEGNGADLGPTYNPEFETGADFGPTYNPGVESGADYGPTYNPEGETGASYGPGPTDRPDDGVFTKILRGMGIAGKDGNVDIGNPATLDKILKVLFTGGSMINTLQGPQGKKSPQELQAALKGPFDSFQGPAATAANSYFGTPLKPRTLQYNRSGASLTPTPRYAEGGDVEGHAPEFLSPGALSTAYVKGDTGGQADAVPAYVAHGEYVFDADSVSNIGDGNNEAGAKVLDAWREKLREHKRAAPSHKIPPKFKGVKAYMPKGEK